MNVQIIKEDNCPIDFEHGWDDDTVDQFFSDYDLEDLSTSKRVSFIKENLKKFLDYYTRSVGCGATVQFKVIDGINPKLIDTEYVFNELFSLDKNSKNYIGRLYCDDFEFDEDSFGYCYFLWENLHILCGGISC